MELKYNKGFTLAEVLITLVIIGVIAAITIPTLMANARRQEASARLKKFYSTVSQACMRAKAMGNDWEEWAESTEIGEDSTPDTSENFAKKYLLPYLNYTDTKIQDNGFYIYLADGSYFTVIKAGCLGMKFDLNGLKLPNQEGRDIFWFHYCQRGYESQFPTGRVIPHTFPYYEKADRQMALNYCKNEPWTCSALLAIDGWEFKEDYPYNI